MRVLVRIFAAGWCALAVLTGTLAAQDGRRPAEGRPAVSETVTAETAAAVFETFQRRCRIERDGRATLSTVARILIREASALPSLGHLYFSYVPAIESIELVALTVDKVGGQRVHLDAAALKELPTPESGAFEGPTFSDTRVKQVAVPALGVGDTLSYELVSTYHTPLAPGHFWTEHSFTRGAIVLDEAFELDWAAEVPLSVRVAGDVVEQQGLAPKVGRRVRRWTHRQPQITAADRRALASAAVAAAKGKAPLPDIQVSTFGAWEQVAAWYRGLAAGAETSSPALREKARSLTASSRDPQAQLAALHEFVSQDVRYVSLAFGDGRYRPRNAELVLSTQYGDCKDKHALLASLAREAGFTVEAVLINTLRPLDEAIPSPGQFNHVISRITGRGLSPIWIDGTSAVTRPGVLLMSLRGKKGLLAGPTPELVVTPAMLGDPQHVRVVITGAYQADGRYRASVRREFRGDVEAGMRALMAGADQQARRQVAEAQAKDDGYGKNTKVVRVASAEPTDLVAPFWWEYDVEAAYTSPNRATAYQFWLPAPDLELPASDDDQEAVDLGPGTFEVTARFELPAALAITPPVAVTIENDLASYTSRYSANTGVLTIERRLVTKVETAPSETLGAYRALRRAAGADYRQKFGVPAASAEAIAASAAERNPSVAGYEALQRGDLDRAVALLRTAVADAPQHKDAWNNLGRALHRQGKWDEAVAAYNRQIEINPFDEYAHNNRGLAEWALKQFGAAESSFRKQIDVAPLDKYAHANLGKLLVERGRFADAVSPLESAVRISADDAWLEIALGRAYAGSGRPTEALAAFDRAVSLKGEPAVWNDVAWRMAEAGLALDKALDYARLAVSGASEQSARAALDRPAKPQIALSAALAAYWDTLGWVHFKRAEIDKALPYLRASWQFRQEPVVGEHLGLAYERLRRPREAFLVYRTVLASDQASETVRERIRALAKADPPPQSDDSQSLALAARTVRLGAIGPPRSATDVMIVADATGVVSAAMPVVTTPQAEQLARGLAGVRLSFVAPDHAPFKLVARAALACSEAPVRCSLVLYQTGDALNAEGDVGSAGMSGQ